MELFLTIIASILLFLVCTFLFAFVMWKIRGRKNEDYETYLMRNGEIIGSVAAAIIIFFMFYFF
jgi:heme/copper-type cytochrome/quinol oxidase subunit 2